MKNKYILIFALSISLLFMNAASAENADSAATPAPTAKSASVLNLSDEELDALTDLLIERLEILRTETSADSVETASDAVAQDSSDGEEKSTESTANKHRKRSSKAQATADASSNHSSAAQLEISNSSEEESSDTTTKDRRSHRHRKHRGGKPTAEKKNRPAESKTSVNSSTSAGSKD